MLKLCQIIVKISLEITMHTPVHRAISILIGLILICMQIKQVVFFYITAILSDHNTEATKSAVQSTRGEHYYGYMTAKITFVLLL